jgi:hypothetical protein
MNRVAAALLCALALTSCANWDKFFYPQSGTSSARDDRESRQVLELIAYARKVAALPADEQLREVNASSQSLSKDRGVGAYGRVRLALLLSLPGTGFTDDAKAAGLLEPIASADSAASAPGPMQQFAGLLYTQISERLREQRRSTQFKEQLDALKDVERKIIERDQGRTR